MEFDCKLCTRFQRELVVYPPNYRSPVAKATLVVSMTFILDFPIHSGAKHFYRGLRPVRDH